MGVKDLPFEYMTEKFGSVTALRVVKLNEELLELNKVMTDTDYGEEVKKACFIDELADVNAVVAHLAYLHGLTQDDLREMAARKIEGRMQDANFMRTKTHLKQ